MNNHDIVVQVQDEFWRMEPRGSHWKVQYTSIKIGAIGTLMKATAVMRIQNPNLDLNYIVSRETLRAIMEIEKHLLETNNLQSVVDQIGRDKFKKKLRRSSVYTFAKRMPYLKKHMDECVLPALHNEYFKELKKYLFRDDVWSPGPRIRKNNHETIACRGLIQLG